VSTLLIVHHTPSPATHALLDAAVRGASDPEITGVRVVRRAALAATASDVLAADGVLLGTPANIGYMSGALKHFFDQVYYPVLDDTKGLPYALYVHGNLGTEGAVRAVLAIADGMGWRPVAEPLEVTGEPDQAAVDGCYELAATLAATLME
jgi:flavorubredoxin